MTGAAWLSPSCREMLLSPNERNLLIQRCQRYYRGLTETAGDDPEEGGDDVKSSYPPGYTRAITTGTMGYGERSGANPWATSSWDRRLQLACVNTELLVIANRHAAVNTFPGFVHTARRRSWQHPVRPNLNEEGAVGWGYDWLSRNR